jgi:predicted Zn-dependent peptidase
MQTRVRTTITLPEETLHRAKLQAVLEKTTLSELIRRRIEDERPTAKKVKKRIHMKLGSLSLGINSTLRREEMYGDYLRHKIPR